jgi:hypothetical protein
MHSNYDITFELPDWVNEYIENKDLETDNTTTDVDSDIIKTLPKIMQFMIECHQDLTLQKDTVEYRDIGMQSYYKKMEEKLNPLAAKRGITFKESQKSFNGLKGINLQKFCNFFQKDKE